MLIRCERCKGNKKISHMGGIMRDCPTCKGVGKTKPAPLQQIDIEIPSSAKPKPKKSKGVKNG